MKKTNKNLLPKGCYKNILTVLCSIWQMINTKQMINIFYLFIKDKYSFIYLKKVTQHISYRANDKCSKKKKNLLNAR